MARVLVVDDNASVRDAVGQVVSRMEHQVDVAADGDAAIAALKVGQFDLVVTDLKMEPTDGMAVLRACIECSPDTVVMLMTAHGSVPAAVAAMREGAWDFIEKPFSVDLLKARISRAIEVGQTRRQAARAEQENEYHRSAAAGGDAPTAQSDDVLASLVGASPAMASLKTMLRKVARAESTIHIFGESGTGKELVASAIHRLSERRHGPFIKVNCGALNDSLLESELFGHEKGAFTDANRRHIGRFELADGGTLFLDEIGDISPAMQVKLLRALQERTFERVGGDKTIQTDVRFVTATNRDLRQEVAAGRFREDLYYRLHIIPVVVPALRERIDDIPVLTRFFIQKLAARTRSRVQSVSAQAMAQMQGYEWPGNVRQLENVVEQALVFAEGTEITLDDLPPALTGFTPSTGLQVPADGRSLPEILEDLERQLIVRALADAHGVKTEAARALGIKTPSLYYKLEKYGLVDGSDS
jgi:two-component system response regulator HydG